MTRSRRRLADAMRCAMLVLLVLGLVVKPVLLAIGDTHAAEHAMVAASDAHGPQDHGDHDDDGKPGNDHTQGAHGLMHQGAGASFAASVPMPRVALVAPPRTDLPPLRLPPRASHSPATPFRPPIG